MNDQAQRQWGDRLHIDRPKDSQIDRHAVTNKHNDGHAEIKQQRQTHTQMHTGITRELVHDKSSIDNMGAQQEPERARGSKDGFTLVEDAFETPANHPPNGEKGA